MATKYWTGAGTNTNWNSSPVTNWANATYNGSNGNQTAPATGDSVFFDANSGTGASVWNTAISLIGLDCTGSKNVVTHGTVTITLTAGNLVLPTGVGGTFTPTSNLSVFSLTGTSGTQQITSNGFSIGGMALNGSGGTFQLQDNFNSTLGSNLGLINFSNGTFDCQTFTVTLNSFTSTSGTTRVLKGSGAWLITNTNASAVTPVNIASGNLTTTNFTAPVTISGTHAGNHTFTWGGSTYSGGLTINANTGGGLIMMTGTPTFGSLTINAPALVTLNATQTVTVTNAITINGTCPNQIGLFSGTLGQSATVSKTSGTPTIGWCAIRDLTFGGGATFVASNSFDLGHNTGITIYPPARIINQVDGVVSP